jgi:hypothetical protein
MRQLLGNITHFPALPTENLWKTLSFQGAYCNNAKIKHFIAPSYHQDSAEKVGYCIEANFNR